MLVTDANGLEPDRNHCGSRLGSNYRGPILILDLNLIWNLYVVYLYLDQLSIKGKKDSVQIPNAKKKYSVD